MSPPQYVYKIFPSASVDTRFAFPIPIPQSHEFFLTELDYKDGVVHLSTAQQVPGVLKRFFADVPAVALIKFDYGRLSAWRRIDWVKADGEEFPHLRGLLDGEQVDSFKEIERGQDWDAALKSIASWLE